MSPSRAIHSAAARNALTIRELEVVKLIAADLTAKQMVGKFMREGAAELGVGAWCGLAWGLAWCGSPRLSVTLHLHQWTKVAL